MKKHKYRTAWLVSLFAAVSCSSEASAPAEVAVAGSGATRPAVASATSGMGAPVRLEPVGSATAGSGAAGKSHAAADSASAAGVGAGGGGMVVPTLSQVYDTVFAMSCAVCHSMLPSDNSNGMLGMIRSKDQFYDALVNKPAQGSKCSGKGAYVVPGKPELSLLVQKVSSTPGCGAQMPLGGMLQPMQVKLISDWIAAGAMK